MKHAMTLYDYRHEREFIWHSLPEGQGITAAPSVDEKVFGDGTLKGYYGDTVIFELEDDVRKWIKAVQDRLYEKCADFMSVPLEEESFHITLHSLNQAGGYRLDMKKLDEQMKASSEKAEAILDSFESRYPGKIRLCSQCLMNMANTSVVMIFEPVSQKDLDALMGMYSELQQVVHLDYSLVPHVTLGYYRPGWHGMDRVGLLKKAIEEANVFGREIELNVEKLHHCFFTDMNTYIAGRRQRTKAWEKYDIDRFLRAQEGMYETALQEIRHGKKQTHWMWYVFPQLRGLGKSANAGYFGLSGLEEATAYLWHPVLDERLKEIMNALLRMEEKDPAKIFGEIDCKKLHACMTLFSIAAGEQLLFKQILKKYFKGKYHDQTLKLLNMQERCGVDDR